MRVLILTYYWPPSGGSGVQRWMYFGSILPESGIEPIVVTVDPARASYKFIDSGFLERVKSIRTYHTSTLEPFLPYSKLLGSKNLKDSIPQGFAGESNPGIINKISRAIRGNFFIPDARVGWNHFAFKKAIELIRSEGIKLVITTGPPHSTHLVGLKLKKLLEIKWIADFRDPWTEVFYNNMMYRNSIAERIDSRFELSVLNYADHILTVGPRMSKLLEGKVLPKYSSKFSHILNGYDEDMFIGKMRNRDNEYFVVCHIGVLSENQPVDAFIKAVMLLYKKDKLPKDRKLKLQLVGKVSPNIINLFKENCSFLNLEIVDYVSHQRAIQYMLDSDLLFNSLAQTEQASLLISGKLMEYLAAAKPIVCLGDENGDASALLKESGNGMVFDRQNIPGLMDFLEKVFCYEFEISAFDIQKYSRRNTARQLAELIKRIY